jgi:pimeloyl-ACP methyl ester carboxylesterase
MKSSKFKIIRKLLNGFLFIPIMALAQSYNIGHTNMAFFDEARNRSISTEIYYPADETGENVELANGGFPVIVFGHGFLMAYEAYANFWTELVPKGYIMAFPTTEMSLSPAHEELGADIRFVADEVLNLNNNESTIFYNSIYAKIALMGHSMGGGASLLASENNANISTVINFAAAETSPSAIMAAANVNVPALIFSGEEDCVAPEIENQIPMYEAINSDCKTHIKVKNGGHCYFADNNFACNLGETFCGNDFVITREEQHETTFAFLNLWLDYTLNGNENALEEFNETILTSDLVNYEQVCASLNTNENIYNDTIAIYPNPVKNELTIKIPGEACNGKYTVSNLYGQIVQQNKTINCKTSINVSALAKGVYVLTYSNDLKQQTTTFLK